MSRTPRSPSIPAAPALAPTAPSAPLEASPWDSVNADGDGLTVDNFLTTRMSQTINALRRIVTLPYAQAHGLTVSEWRLLSLVAHAQSIPFGELVVQSTSDKALVSRTVRLLEERRLVRIEAEGPTPRKKLTIHITPEGDALHAQVIPIARQRQAEMIRVMTLEERRALFSGLQKLLDACLRIQPDAAQDSGSGQDA